MGWGCNVGVLEHSSSENFQLLGNLNLMANTVGSRFKVPEGSGIFGR